MPYSRDETVDAVLSFYEFLQHLHIPEDAIKRPPPGGWPEINQERLGFLEKDDTVIDLLKHLPYIDQDRHSRPYEIGNDTVCNDYVGLDFQDSVECECSHETEGLPELMDDDEDDLPPVIRNGPLPFTATLARGNTRDGDWFYCDTRDGKIWVNSFINGRGGVYANAKEFFEMLKQQYVDLDWFPTSPYWVIAPSRKDKSDPENKLRKVFRKYGWPTDQFQREKCMAKVEKLHDKM